VEEDVDVDADGRDERWKSNQDATGREMKARGEDREGRRSRNICSWSDNTRLAGTIQRRRGLEGSDVQRDGLHLDRGRLCG
jgi:hypothetical protein